MSHHYQEYSERLKYIDRSQYKYKKELDSYSINHISQFDSIDRLLKAINYFIMKRSGNGIYINHLEDALLFILTYCKLLSAGTYQEFINNSIDAKKLIDTMNRLIRKGYIEKTSQRDENSMSYYCLTEDGWTYYKQLAKNNPKLIPSSDYNYSCTGLVHHDACVGKVYLRLLLLKMPYIFTRYYYSQGMRKSNDVYPDAIVRVLPSSENERSFFIEGDTGTEGVEAIIEKIGKYYFKKYVNIEKENYILFVYEKKDNNFFRDFFPCLFGDSKQIIIVYKLIKFFQCTLDEIIDILERTIDGNEKDENSIISEDFYKKIAHDKHGKYISYKLSRCLLCAKSIRLLFSLSWIEKFIPEINNVDSDIKKINMLYSYFDDHKYSNGIQTYIKCMKNMHDTVDRKISITKGIIARHTRLNEVINMNDALSCICSGVDILFGGSSACEKHVLYSMKMESETLYRKIIKKRLEEIFSRKLFYEKLLCPFVCENNKYISNIYLKNCYFYFENEDSDMETEIYVENISLSLSAMVRVAIIVNELMGVSLDNRNVTIICLVDNLMEMRKFDNFLHHTCKKYNGGMYSVPVRYMLIDSIKHGQLFSC